VNHPDDVPTSLTRRAYALRGVTLSQNQYAAVVADAYEDIKREVLREAAEKQRRYRDEVDPWVSRDFLIDLIDPDKEEP
jgi:GrpB-like predicted nucleotidyltransferase (UPF0157 family)